MNSPVASSALCASTDAQPAAMVPRRAEWQQAAALPAAAGVVPVAAEAIDMGALLRFKALMAASGQPVQLPRMCFDRLYAFHCIAQAHAEGNDLLRRLALELFQAYHRRDENRQILTS